MSTCYVQTTPGKKFQCYFSDFRLTVLFVFQFYATFSTEFHFSDFGLATTKTTLRRFPQLCWQTQVSQMLLFVIVEDCLPVPFLMFLMFEDYLPVALCINWQGLLTTEGDISASFFRFLIAPLFALLSVLHFLGSVLIAALFAVFSHRG